MLIKNDYKIIKNKITYYRQIEGGLESNWKKFSLAWWNRRYQAHTYLRELYKIKNKKINKNFDFLISKILSKFS